MRTKSLHLSVVIFIVLLAIGIFFTQANQFWKGVKPLFNETLPSDELSEFSVHPEFSLRLLTDEVTNPRVLVETKERNIIVSEPAESRVSVVTPNGDRVTLLSDLNRPHGLALLNDKLYVAETDQVVEYDFDGMQASNPNKLFSLPADGRHWTRTLGIGPDKQLYVSAGSSCNICIEEEWERNKILKFDFDSEQLEEFAIGLRNAVFFAWHPETNELFATEMGRDWLGDDLPPDELNLIKEGGDYGFPFCYGNKIPDPEYDDLTRCESTEGSYYDFIAHESPLGIDFYQGDPVVALHGSWNRSEPVGYEVIRLDDQKNRESILSGFLVDDETTIGRPAGILVTSDERILVSDDKGHRIYELIPVDQL